MFLFKNYYIIMFDSKFLSILKLNLYYFLNIFSPFVSKTTFLPLGNNIIITNDGIYIFFLNNINLYKNYFYYLKYMFYSWEHFIVKKIKFRYKGSWIFIKKKKLNSIIMEFGKSHHVKLFLFGCLLSRKKKLLAAHLFSIYGINVVELYFYAFFLRSVRSFNMYTLRGIRFSRQKFYKRVGKISKYTMFKSKIF